MKLTRILPALLGLITLSLSAADKPDVLFIAVDDLNDWVTHLGGHPQAKTPNIDRLVARGTTFSNTHCAAPACNPSRAALMSGLRPWQTGIYTNEDPAAKVLKETTTINRHFMAQGYNTLGGGKIYHNINAEGRDDTWTEWAGLFPTINGKERNLNGLKSGHFDWGAVDAKPQEMGDYKLTDWAVDHLKNAPADKPLFLAVGYVKPHLPWYVPKEYFDRFPLDGMQLPVVKEGDLADIPSAGKKMAKPAGDHAKVVESGQWKQAVQAYLATISFLDDQVGRLLDGLDASPRKDKTIIVWWTDHGWALGEKEHWRKFAAPPFPSPLQAWEKQAKSAKLPWTISTFTRPYASSPVCRSPSMLKVPASCLCLKILPPPGSMWQCAVMAVETTPPVMASGAISAMPMAKRNCMTTPKILMSGLT